MRHFNYKRLFQTS